MKTFFVFIFILIGILANAQSWKRTRYELIGGIGATSFMGDIGAPENIGIKKYFWLTPQSFRPNSTLGLRYRITPKISAKTILSLGIISADDEYGAWKTKIVNGVNVSRGMHFRSVLVEWGVQGEYQINKERRKRNIYGANRFKTRIRNINIPTYFFAGVGAVYFNPKIRTGGQWRPLQEYRSDTTGLSKTNFSMVIMGGIGFRYKINSRTYFGVEATTHYCSNDNMDDFGEAKTTYDLPGLGLRKNVHGGKYNDVYNTLTFNVIYKLKTNRKGLPRLNTIF